MELKTVINDPKAKKSYKKVMESNPYLGKKIGEKVSGDELGLNSYELEIRGGSDNSGFAMRPDLPIAGKKKVLLTSGVGIKLKRKGMQKRKTVAGNTVSELTAGLNLKIVKYGSKSVEDCLGLTPKKEEKKEPKQEVKKEEKTSVEEKPKQEPKKE